MTATLKPYQRLLAVFVLLLAALVASARADRQYPAYCTTTTSLNIRATDNAHGRKLATVPRGTRLKVDAVGANGWAQIDYNGRTAYCANRYLAYAEPIAQQQQATPLRSSASRHKSSSGGFWTWCFKIGVLLAFLAFLRKVLLVVLGALSALFYKAYRLISLPFYFLNWLQRFLAKPWFLFYKSNTRSDAQNAQLRQRFELWKRPLYVLLTPLRLLNAAYYNLLIHCNFELFNYLVEIIAPASEKEGAGNFLLWVALLPWRVVKYLFWHGSLTLIESVVWTIIDTFVPALTLFHGTSCSAAESITQGAGRVQSKDWYTGVWNVGGGNYAGNGIYFAPKRDTALHYSAGSLIVCRVSLGRTLDLGLAPKSVYNLCGYPNALGVTDWGLRNGYVTGEWWRGDRRALWWEYCMYDWQNRYNDSWRIRPLYVLNLSDECIQRIPGGMYHWLFQQMVLDDLSRHIEKKLG